MRVVPGLAFSIVCDRGFALGLHTHKDATMGSLIWLADGFWDEEPTATEIATAGWRWCVFFPLGAAVRRRLVTPLGLVAIPTSLQGFPTMRAGSREQGWFAVRNEAMEGVLGHPTYDRSLPPRQIVNDTRLKEMLVTGWRPEDDW